MSWISSVPSPPPPPPGIPPPKFDLKETEELDVITAYKQRQDVQEWLFASVTGYRSLHTIPRLHQHTLVHGLSVLRQRIADLVNLDLKLYHKYASLLSDNESSEKAFAYTGWCWLSPPSDTLEMLNRADLERLMWKDMGVYDAIVKSVRMWKKEVDARIGQRQNLERRERRPWEL